MTDASKAFPLEGAYNVQVDAAVIQVRSASDLYASDLATKAALTVQKVAEARPRGHFVGSFDFDRSLTGIEVDLRTVIAQEQLRVQVMQGRKLYCCSTFFSAIASVLHGH